jgi:hypothetical protein
MKIKLEPMLFYYKIPKFNFDRLINLSNTLVSINRGRQIYWDRKSDVLYSISLSDFNKRHKKVLKIKIKSF